MIYFLRLLSCPESIIKKVANATIYDNVMGSDHCPIGLNVNI
jgi:exonuclease III